MGRGFAWAGIVLGGLLVASPMAGAGAATTAATPVVQMRAAEDVAVPDVRCSAFPEVQSTLAAAGLVVQQLSGRYGVALSQSPPPGERVAAGSPVYVVMQPPGHPRVPVPDVRGRNLPTATRLLARSCLDVAVSDRMPHGHIARQSPEPATLARVGTRVSLVERAAPTSPTPGSGGARANGGSGRPDSMPAATGSGSVGWGAVGLLALVVLAMAVGVVVLWRRLVQSRPHGKPASGLPAVSVRGPVGAGAGGPPPVATKSVTEPLVAHTPEVAVDVLPGPDDPAGRFTWVARRGPTATTIDEVGS